MTSQLPSRPWVDQACQGPLRQHKWGGPCVPVPIHLHITEVGRYKGTRVHRIQRYEGTRAPAIQARFGGCPSFRGRARLGTAAQLAAMASSRLRYGQDNLPSWLSEHMARPEQGWTFSKHIARTGAESR